MYAKTCSVGLVAAAAHTFDIWCKGFMEEYSFANSSALDFPVNVRMFVPVCSPIDLPC